MPQKCQVCIHPDVKEIEKQIVQGIAHTTIAARYTGLDHQNIRRHAENHLPEKLVQAVADEKADHAENILEGINNLLDRTKNILDQAEKKGQNRLALDAIKEVRGTYELLSRIAVKLAEYKHDAEMEVQEAETGPKTLADLYNEEREQDGRLGLGRLQAMGDAGNVLTLEELKEYQRIQMKLLAATDPEWLTTKEQQDLEDYQRVQGYDDPPKTRPIRVRETKNTKNIHSKPGQLNKPKITIKRKPEPDDFDMELDDLNDLDLDTKEPEWLKEERTKQIKNFYRPDW